MRKLFAPIGFCLFLAAGYLVSVESWNGAVFVYLGELRSPASVRSMRDYSIVDRKALFASVHKQLLEGAKLMKDDGTMGLTLGHPLMKASDGNDFACPVPGRAGLFDRVELTFLGLGISESGHQPKMVVEADCNPGTNLSQLSPIWIPMAEIVAAGPKDQDLQFYGEQPKKIRLEHIPGEWPTTWVLTSVRFFRQAFPDENMLINAEKMRETNGGKLISFDWQTK